MTVLAPSDNPNVYASSLRQGAKLTSWETGARVAREAADELQIGERALDSAGSILEEAASLVVQGSNETLSTTDRSALAARVSVLREELVTLANTRGATGYLFGGTRTDTPPFDAAGTFQGNDGAVYVPVSDGVSPRGNLSGARAFTAAGGRDVFADLAALSTALASGNLAGIRGSIALSARTTPRGFRRSSAARARRTRRASQSRRSFSRFPR